MPGYNNPALQARQDRLRAQDVAAATARQASADDLAEALAKADAQRAAADLERQGALAVAQEETRRAAAANQNALALERLRGENANALAGINTASAERVAQERAQAMRDVAAIQAAAQAARAQGALTAEQETAFKRAQDLASLGARLMNGGMDAVELRIAEGAIDSDETLSDEEKAARKAQLRADTRQAGLWMIAQARQAYERAGLPGMPAAGAQAAPAPEPAAPGLLSGLADWR